MNNIITHMTATYSVTNLDERRNASRQIIQEVMLCGLSRSDFFKKAAFYGGTALRIFHHLDRFSEDLDFSLLYPDHSFSWTLYVSSILHELNSLGIKMEIQYVDKSSDSNIKSAYLQGLLCDILSTLFPDQPNNVNPDQKLKIKIEIDTNPPMYATYENQYGLLPFPYLVQLYDYPSLFAGKIHAVLARKWKNRAKGRDYYDYLFYLSQGVKVNIKHLKQRLIESGDLSKDDKFDLDILKEALKTRFQQIDFQALKLDVIPFVGNHSLLEGWDSNLFIQTTNTLKSI